MMNLSAAELPASSEEDADGARVLGVGEKQGDSRKGYCKHSDKLGSRKAKVTDYPTKRLAALKNLNDFLSKHTDVDPVLARSFYENAMACEGNAISGKESQKHLDSMRCEHSPAILASWEALPGFVDSGIKVCSLPARITSTINAQRKPGRTKVQLLPLQN
jgi:hypothetical protein